MGVEAWPKAEPFGRKFTCTGRRITNWLVRKVRQVMCIQNFIKSKDVNAINTATILTDLFGLKITAQVLFTLVLVHMSSTSIKDGHHPKM